MGGNLFFETIKHSKHSGEWVSRWTCHRTQHALMCEEGEICSAMSFWLTRNALLSPSCDTLQRGYARFIVGYFKQISFEDPQRYVDHGDLAGTEESLFTVNVFEAEHHIRFT